MIGIRGAIYVFPLLHFRQCRFHIKLIIFREIIKFPSPVKIIIVVGIVFCENIKRCKIEISRVSGR